MGVGVAMSAVGVAMSSVGVAVLAVGVAVMRVSVVVRGAAFPAVGVGVAEGADSHQVDQQTANGHRLQKRQIIKQPGLKIKNLSFSQNYDFNLLESNDRNWRTKKLNSEKTLQF